MMASKMTENSLPENTAISLTVNGEPRLVAADIRLSELIESLGFSGQRIAAEVNGEVVPKAKHQKCLLQDGDRIEIICFVGGG